MKITVLGSGTSVPHPQRAAAGFWLETGGGSLLLDCSGDAPHRMAEENLDWMNLDAIWISHLHLDHCAGLAPLLFGLKWAPGSDKREKPLHIAGCQGVRKSLTAIDESHNLKLFEQHFLIKLQEVAARETVTTFGDLAGLKAETISTPHRAESLAIRLTEPDGTVLVYSSDTGYSEDLAAFARGADLFILECSFPRHKPVETHLELAEAMRIAKIAEPRKLLLTHLYPEWNGVDIEAAAREHWSGETMAARDGLRLEISRR